MVKMVNLSNFRLALGFLAITLRPGVGFSSSRVYSIADIKSNRWYKKYWHLTDIHWNYAALMAGQWKKNFFGKKFGTKIINNKRNSKNGKK